MSINFNRIIFFFAVAGYAIFGLALSAEQSVSKLGAVFSIGGVLFWIFRTKAKPEYFKILLLFVIYMLTTYFWSPETEISSFGNFLTALAGGVIVSEGIRLKWIKVDHAIVMMLLIGLINYYAYVNKINYTDLLGEVDFDVAFRRFGGYTGHPNALCTRLLLPIYIYAFFGEKITAGWWKFILGILCIACALFGLYSTGSKKAVVLLIPMLYFWYVQLMSTENVTRKGGFGRKILVSLLVVLTTIWYMASIDFYEFEVFNRFEQAIYDDEDSSTSGRADLIKVAPDMFLNSPFFGNGFNAFSIESGFGYYSHNNYVELLVNAGIFGLFIYYGLLYVGLFKYSKLFGTIRFISLALIFLILDFTGVSYGDRASQIMFLLMLSQTVWVKNK